MTEGFLERVWAQREEEVYPGIFGDLGPGIYPLAADTFRIVFQQDPDPRWLFIGVFECPPNPKHADWVYVSSGLSNPWEQDAPADSSDDLSWLGVELAFRCSEQGAWAIELVQRITAFELLLAHDRYKGREDLNFGDRIPLHGPIVPESNSALTHLLVAPPAEEPDSFQLESGLVYFMQLVGISESEARFGRENGLEALLQVLHEHDVYSVTDPHRPSVL